MIDYNLIEVGLACEGMFYEEAEVCYELTREYLFDEIGGLDFFNESFEEMYYDDYFREAVNISAGLQNAKAIVKKNKKKIAIISACAVAILATVVILNNKGKSKEAEQAKKIASSLKETAKKLGEENKAVETNVRTVAKEQKRVKTPKEAKTVEKKVEQIVVKAQSVEKKVESTEQKAKATKEKFYAPAVVNVTDKDLSKRHENSQKLDFDLSFHNQSMEKYAYELEKYYGKDFQKRVFKKLYKLSTDPRSEKDPEYTSRALEYYAQQLAKDPNLKGGPFTSQNMAYNFLISAIKGMGKSIRKYGNAYKDNASGKLLYDTAVNARNKAERRKVYR